MIFLKKLNLILFCFFLVGLFLVPFFISAQGLEIQYPSIPFSNIQTPNQFAGQEDAFPLYLNYFYHFALMIAGLITFGVIVFGGAQYLTSVGSMTKIINAKEQIFGGFMGLIILLASYMILIAIDPNLIVFNIAALEEKTKIIDVAEIDFGKTVYFEIPIGMIIENAVLDDLYLQKMNIAKQAAEQASQASQELKDLTDSLREETNKCRCNTTQCAGPPGCQGISCPNAQCNKAEIERISREIERQIEKLKQEELKVDAAILPLIDDLSQIEAASYLMSIKNDEIFSYNSLLSIEEDYEIETFPIWQNLYLKINNDLIKDPLTFYLDGEKNRDDIFLASILPVSFYSETEWTEPEGGWPPVPEGIPNVPLYKQKDPRWAKNPYPSPCTVGGSGCGPTALAMVLSYYTGTTILPDKTANLGVQYNHAICGAGSKASLLSDSRITNPVIGTHKVWATVGGWQEILKKLEEGPVIISVGPSIFTSGGHYIVLKGIKENIIYINDSYKNIHQAWESQVREAFLNGSGIYAWFKR